MLHLEQPGLVSFCSCKRGSFVANPDRRGFSRLRTDQLFIGFLSDDIRARKRKTPEDKKLDNSLKRKCSGSVLFVSCSFSKYCNHPLYCLSSFLANRKCSHILIIIYTVVGSNKEGVDL